MTSLQMGGYERYGGDQRRLHHPRGADGAGLEQEGRDGHPQQGGPALFRRGFRHHLLRLRRTPDLPHLPERYEATAALWSLLHTGLSG